MQWWDSLPATRGLQVWYHTLSKDLSLWLSFDSPPEVTSLHFTESKNSNRKLFSVLGFRIFKKKRTECSFQILWKSVIMLLRFYSNKTNCRGKTFSCEHNDTVQVKQHTWLRWLCQTVWTPRDTLVTWPKTVFWNDTICASHAAAVLRQSCNIVCEYFPKSTFKKNVF